MELAALITFAAVARKGAITRAAEELHTVQSNVTARIRLLERELGVPLFYRHARGVTLTSAGEQLLPYAIKISQLVSEAQRALGDRSAPRGTLRIGSLESTAGHRLPPVLAAFNAANPEVDLTLVTGTTAGLVDDVLAYRLEGALVAGPIGHPELAEEPMLEEELVIVSSPAWPGLDAPREGPRAVKVLVLRAGCSYRERLERLLAARGVVAAAPMEFGTLEGIIGCAGAGLGITLLPRVVVAPAWRRGEIAVHALPPEDAHAVTVFIRRQDAYVSAAHERFVACCRSMAHAVPGGRRHASQTLGPNGQAIAH